MSFVRTIISYEDKTKKQDGKLINERKRQAQIWLRRQEEKKKRPTSSKENNYG